MDAFHRTGQFMKDLQNLLVFGSTAFAAFLILYLLSGKLSGGEMVGLAVTLVVVLPVALGVVIAKREHARNAGQGKG